MRSLLCIFMTIMYCFLFSIYILEIPNPDISPQSKHLLYSILTAGMVSFSYVDCRVGFEGEWHVKFNSLCFFSVVMNFCIIIANWLTWFTDPILMFCIFNGSVAVVTAYIGFFAHKYKFLNK